MNRRHANPGAWPSTIAHALGGGALLVCVAISGGCYERVVKAKGIGASSMTVQEPYASNTALDNAVMGPPAGSSTKKRVKSTHWEPIVK